MGALAASALALNPVGEPIELYLPTIAAGVDATISTPDGRTETAHTQSQEESGVLRWTDTDVSGIYRAVIGQHPGAGRAETRRVPGC